MWTTVEMQGDRGGARIPKTGEVSTWERGETSRTQWGVAWEGRVTEILSGHSIACVRVTCSKLREQVTTRVEAGGGGV